jgi:hypothetical protein
MASDAIAQHIRESSLSDIESDIPAGLTLAEYAASRRQTAGGGLKARVASLLRPRRTR